MPPFTNSVRTGRRRRDSQQKCSNLMEWGGQAKGVSARGAGAIRDCSITERYIHTWRYEERRDHARPMPRKPRKTH